MFAHAAHNSPVDPLSEAHGSVDLSEDQIRRWILNSRRRSGAIWFRRRLAMMALLIASLVVMFTTAEDAPAWRRFLPVGLVAGVMIASWRFSGELRRLKRRFGQAMGRMQFQQWSSAVSAMDELMSAPIDVPDMRAAALLSAAELGTRAGEHDAAVAALDEVLAEPVSPPYKQSAMVEKAQALLRAERLTEATTLLDSFRNLELAEPAATVAAVAQLYRRIRTRNFAAVADEADALAARARTLFHRQAGYVYGLIALALHQIGQTDRAQTYYDCATRLLSPDELAHRYRELAKLADHLTPARSPL